jgi:hexosaminidase
MQARMGFSNPFDRKIRILAYSMNTSILRCILLCFFVIGYSFAGPGSPISIIPQPKIITEHPGYFLLTRSSSIIFPAHSPVLRALAEQCSTQIHLLNGFHPNIASSNTPDKKNNIVFTLGDSALGKEDYDLTVSKNGIIIQATTEAGVFYGIQSLFQLFPIDKKSQAIKIPCMQIHDGPRFHWRGMHLDVSRHFLPKEFIKTFIDILAMHKMNIFHWHLTDDQGWRIEIKKYPRLTDIGAWRVDREFQEWNARSPQHEGEPATYGGFYTQDDIRDIVAYARKRFITIVPEIEMPAHTTAALAAYPQFSCSGGPFKIPTGGVWPITDIYCTGNDSSFIFLQDVLTEIMDLFPGKFIHVGGDEADKSEWKTCPKCQQRIKSEGLKNEDELQSYFIKRIEKFLSDHGRRLIGWDEILEGGLAPEATVMSWRGMDGGIAAVRQGHDVVMTPGSYCYFNAYQGKRETEPPAGGGILTLEHVYSFDPLPPQLDSNQIKHVLGAQGCLWSEYISTPEHVEYMALPRIAALAEVVWSPKASLDWKKFIPRIETMMEQYKKLEYHYAKSVYSVDIQSPLDTTHHRICVSLSNQIGTGEIRYTTDGEWPSKCSKKYTKPLTVRKTTTIKAGTFRNGILLNKISEQTVFVHKAFSKPAHYKLSYNKYTGGGDYALTNGIRGTKSFDDGNWQGFEQNDLDATIDLGREMPIHRISAGFLQNTVSWIFFPLSIEYHVSIDGINFTTVGTFPQPIASKHEEVQIKEFPLELKNIKARYIKVTAQNVGICPEWHSGKGGKAWLFIDEIIVK